MAGGVLDLLVGDICIVLAVLVLISHLGRCRLFLEQRLQTIGNGVAGSVGAGWAVS